MTPWVQYLHKSDQEIATGLNYVLKALDDSPPWVLPPEALRQICHRLLDYLPFEELPYVADDLGERAGDYFEEFEGWRPLTGEHGRGAWLANSISYTELPRTTSGV